MTSDDGGAQTFGELLDGKTTSRYGDRSIYSDYSYIIARALELGLTEKAGLKALQGRVCAFHHLDLDAVWSKTLSEFVELLKATDKNVPLTPADDEAEAVEQTSDKEHSSDFRSVRWDEKPHTFTALQAACVNVLWKNWKKGTPEVGEQTILELADTTQKRLSKVFDDGKHSAWGTMIVPGATKGTFRLSEAS